MSVSETKHDHGGPIRGIFPTKMAAAEAAAGLAASDNRIRRLIVFGSAVTPDCGDRSDLDIAIDAPGVGEDEFLGIARAFHLEVPSELDVIWYNRIRNGMLKDEIDRNGVIIYVKRQ